MANGKGDLRRPSVIPEHELGARWFACFANTRLPSNPAVARSEIAAAEGAKGGQYVEQAFAMTFNGVPVPEPDTYDGPDLVGTRAVCSKGLTGTITGRKLLPWGWSWIGVTDAGEQWASRTPQPEPYEVEHKEINGQPVTVLTAEDKLPSPMIWILEDGRCYLCNESAKLSTRCHGGTNTKSPGPRRK